MKKQYLLISLLALVAGSVVTAKYGHDTPEERQTYLQDKMDRGDKEETPEFRFALKYLEYLRKFLSNEISHDEFVRIIHKKINTLKENIARVYKRSMLNEHDNAFLVTCLTSTEGELARKVGTREKAGTMQRYVKASSSSKPASKKQAVKNKKQS